MGEEQSPSSKGPAQRWRGGAAQSQPVTGAPARGRGKKFFLVGLFFLALIAVVVALFSYLQPDALPVFLGIAVREYKAREFPANFFAVQDSQLLKDHFEKGRAAYQSQDLEGITRELRSLRNEKEPVVVYLCALARATEDDVYVLPADAMPDGQGHWLSLRDVLQEFRACKSPHKLLLLDIMRPVADARLGVLADDIAGRVHALLEKERDLPPVFCSCSADELSLVSETLGSSIFAYYLDQALKGHADGYGDGRKDRRVSVKELTKFVTDRVQRWAWQNQAQRQTPLLRGSDDDFVLGVVEDAQSETPSEKTPRYPDWLATGWALRDKQVERLVSAAPLLLRRLEVALLQAESRWRAGYEDERNRLKNELNTELDRFKEHSAKIEIAARLPAVSLGIFFEGSPEANPAMVKEVRGLVARISASSPVPEDKPKPWKEEVAKLQKKLEEAPFEQVARVVVQAALKEKSLPRPVAQVVGEILAFHPKSSRYVETVRLERLAQLSLDMENELTAKAAHHALSAVHEAEAAVGTLGVEPLALVWVRDLFQAADGKRRAAEAQLFSGSARAAKMAIPALQETEELYLRIRERVNGVQRARHDLYDALRFLAGLAPSLVAQSQVDAAEETAWRETVDAATKLADVLVEPDPQALAQGELQAAITLRQRIRELKALFAEKLRRHGGAGERDARDLLGIQALLESPLLGAEERRKLWLSSQKLGSRLHEQTAAIDDAENRGNPITKPLPGTNPFPDWERARAKRRAWLAGDLLALAGLQTRALRDQLADATHRAAWPEVAKLFNKYWQPRGSDFFRNAPVKQKERMTRVLQPFQVEGTEAGSTNMNIASTRFRAELNSLAEWLANRYQAESKLARPGGPESLFLRDAAEKISR